MPITYANMIQYQSICMSQIIVIRTHLMNLKIIILVLLISIPALSWQYHHEQLDERLKSTSLKQEIYWFDQIKDHYNYQNSNTWSQRYYVYDDYFNPEKGPIILYICGQAECHGISDASWTAKIAQQTQGLVLSLQHRFYGKSLPFGNNSLDFANLKYLTAEQALKDLAYFLTTMKTSKKHNILQNNPWITIGGSYPGALAAWFRQKYPHLTVGSISSSGVILAVEDFKMFDEQIFISSNKSGISCPNMIKNVTDYVQSQVTGDQSAAFQAEFSASKLTARQFLFYWSDAIVFQIQYGNRVQFCQSLKDKTLQESYNIMKALVKKVTPVDYGSFYLGNATFSMQDGRGARSWIYQSCTQFSYFQTYSSSHPMRSRLLSLSFYQKWCEDIFGKNTWPFVDRKNLELGGLKISANNLIMTNGQEDPWQWAGLRQNSNPNIYSKIINCSDCAHCVDLRSPNSKKDDPNLTDIRSKELQSIKKWVFEHWKVIKN